VLIVHEDSRTGGIGESLAAIIQEEAFESLDAPVRIIGALDTPVPYSPPLEEFFLPSEVFANIASSKPQFAGLSYETLGMRGLPVLQTAGAA
jgi:pyruvate/2-oxoglutarate/acetoin dehydrogenase E1 component